jgi:hypothetical protein
MAFLIVTKWEKNLEKSKRAFLRNILTLIALSSFLSLNDKFGGIRVEKVKK